MNFFINLFLRDISFLVSMVTMMMTLRLFLIKSCIVCSCNNIFKKRRNCIIWNWLDLIDTTSFVWGYTSALNHNWWRIRKACWISMIVQLYYSCWDNNWIWNSIKWYWFFFINTSPWMFTSGFDYNWWRI